jgi:hypothetical protein
MQVIKAFSNIRISKPFGAPGIVEVKYGNNTYIKSTIISNLP